MNNLITRGLSGIVYIALIIFAVLGPESKLKCSVLFAVFAIVGAYEFFHMTRCLTLPTRDGEAFPAMTGIEKFNVAIGVISVGLLVGIYCLGRIDGYLADIAFACIGAFFIARWILTIFDSGAGSALLRLALWVGCFLYLGATLTLSLMMPSTLLLATFILIWVNDTGAFCVGSLIGKHKMSPRLSPKKSWEGFAGGIIFCLIAALIFHFCKLFTEFSLLSWLVLGACVGILATWGDLFESLIKRTCGVKDSGKIIPGHGGILDRIDSFLMVGPLVSILYMVLKML